MPLPQIEDRPEKVAVVGGGPAGLTAAYYLRLKGVSNYALFDALDRLGGMLRVGIPDYRLPPGMCWTMKLIRILGLGHRDPDSTMHFGNRK